MANSNFSQVTKKPNILLIYTDQQRHNTIRSLGNQNIITPNLDKLVEGGTAFTHAFVASPVCVASRWILHSGMYTTSNQAYSNHHVLKDRPDTSLPFELKKQGYQTVLLGKNHCFLDSKDMDFIDPGIPFQGKPEDGKSADKAMPWTVEDDPMHVLTSRAINLLSNNSEDNDKPIFMWLSYLYPHDPFMCPEPYFSMYDSIEIEEPIIEPNGLKEAGKPFRQQFHQENYDRVLDYDKNKIMRMKRNYYGMISMIDAEIGRILDFLEMNNLRKNTIIIFTSDHGDYMGDHRMLTKSPAMYDCLVRVPLIFSWPGKIKQGQIINELVSSVDLMPTFLDFAEIPIPSQVQGTSLVNILSGQSSTKKRDFIFSEYGIPGKPIKKEELDKEIPDYHEKPIVFQNNPKHPWEGNPVGLAGRIRMIRTHDFKLVEENLGTNELYDLKNDPNELMNVYNLPEYNEIQVKLLNALNEWKSSLPGIEKDFFPIAEENFQKYLIERKEYQNNSY